MPRLQHRSIRSIMEFRLSSDYQVRTPRLISNEPTHVFFVYLGSTHPYRKFIKITIISIFHGKVMDARRKKKELKKKHNK
jgi:hypothetical protein